MTTIWPRCDESFYWASCKEAYFWLDRTYDPDCHVFYFPQYQLQPSMLKSESALWVILEIPCYSGLFPFLKFSFFVFVQVFKFHCESLALLDPGSWLLMKCSSLFPWMLGSWRLEKNNIWTRGKKIIHPIQTLNSVLLGYQHKHWPTYSQASQEFCRKYLHFIDKFSGHRNQHIVKGERSAMVSGNSCSEKTVHASTCVNIFINFQAASFGAQISVFYELASCEDLEAQKDISLRSGIMPKFFTCISWHCPRLELPLRVHNTRGM